MIPGVGGVPRARLFALLLLTLVEVIARALGDPAPYVGHTALQGGGSSKAAGIFSSTKQNDVTSVTTQLAKAGGSTGASSDLWIHPEDGEALPVGAPRIERSTAKRHSAGATDTGSKYNFHFAHAVYNVSIPENSVIKTYAVQPPNEDRMGIHVTPDLEVKYKIVSGDKDKFFKAEERAVGDFVFLAIRLRTNNIVLNREKGDSYRLEVKATGTRREGKSRISLEADTVIDVRVLDANDLSPLFYPTEYSVAITEDTPLHKSILHVVAEDADLGLNGEIYYSILDETEQFAVHPTTGVITLTRPLRFTDRALHELTVVANDRGIGSTRNQASKARVKN
ncbi:cadherin [Anopheles sinensis]|uniref:Cadherin n=1 Tax=Anopheles sinensis TaxID=74873 RepID=A0A084VRM8_ANOSI|nr:cadherin [Anopheles sinensis]